MHLSKFFETTTGKYMLSIILGFGLASLFRQVCKGKNCLIFQSPPLEDILDNVYKYNNKCYKYTTTSVACDKNKKTIEIAHK